MGVKGWNRFLAEEGWIPDDTKGPCCSISLFCEHPTPITSSVAPSVGQLSSYTAEVEDDGINNTEQKRSPRVIPPNSEFHVDGNGLCFHLVKIAYARHINTILHGKWNHHQCPCIHTTPLQVTAKHARKLLPSFIPLKLIADVTNEFVRSLRDDHKIALFVYWDGSERYIYKQDTDQQRRNDRNEDWSNLHQYCLHGTLPRFNHRSKTLLCDFFLKQFPQSKLYSAQIFHTLHSKYKLPCFQCVNEADYVLAQRVSQKRNSYVVAFDSDFCFYSHVQYIPISTIHIKKNHTEKGSVLAQVLSRELFAESLRFSDSDVMVELAILLGNDYISPSTMNGNHIWINGMKSSNFRGKVKNISSRNMSPNRWSEVFDDIVSFLQNQKAGFRLRSSCSKTEEAGQFVRQLYNLSLPDESSCLMSSYTLKDFVASRNDFVSVTESMRPHVTDAELDILEIRNDPSQGTIREAIVHSMQVHVNNCNVDAAFDDMQKDELLPASKVLRSIRQEHVLAFSDFSIHGDHNDVDDGFEEKTLRPMWEDFIAVYLIEKIIVRVYEMYWLKDSARASSSISLPLNPPYVFFDAYKYQVFLCMMRNKVETPARESDSDQGASSKPSGGSLDSTGIDSFNDKIVSRPKLPVDEFESEILNSVYRNRVTIIQGETGCGKSSRIPVMLLRASPPPDSPHKVAKLFVSQPRRIATKALVEHLRRVEPDLRDQIALRMGHGVREYETSSTRALFVTVGYLTRLLINIPDRFSKVTYVIIDEVHERSVDMDVLCLLCRRLLSTNSHTRLILMSATLAAGIYQHYFNVKDPVIYVGSRRFPVEDVFLSDLPRKVKLSSNLIGKITSLSEELHKMKCMKSPSIGYMEKLFAVVANVAVVVGKPGTSVLIFVSGMNDIIGISEIIDQFHIPGTVFTCLPIHGDIPFEDQMQVFAEAKPNEVKIIISTNAAESSVTLPDVDNVICLGLCKQIEYNPISHRQILVPTWISRASAIQRAGRTGRLRPGTVYRMYEKLTYSCHMEEFERGEMLRIPLDSVILTLKQMLPDERVTEILASCLEPPNTCTIDRSFESLFQSNLISEASDIDSCNITKLGLFVSQLGIDLTLGSLIGLGIQFGVGAEAIRIAGILSYPNGPWIQSSPFFHGTEDFNDLTVKTFASRCHFDANLYSEPLAIMNVLWEYGQTPSSKRLNWCLKQGIFLPRIKRLDGTCKNLQQRVAEYFDIPIQRLEVSLPPTQMPHSKITVLRVIQFWVFHDTMIQFDPSKIVNSQTQKDQYVLEIRKNSSPVKTKHLEQVFKDRQRYPFTICGQVYVQQNGSFPILPEQINSEFDFLAEFRTRLLSYSTECKYAIVNADFNDCFVIYVHKSTKVDLVEAIPTLATDQTGIEFSMFKATPQPAGKSLRGRSERPCGLWIVTAIKTAAIPGDESEVLWFEIFLKKTKNNKALLNAYVSECEAYLRTSATAQRRLSFKVSCGSIIDSKKENSVNFNLSIFGEEKGLSDLDLKDLFASTKIKSTPRKTQPSQSLIFPIVANKPCCKSSHATDPSKSQSDFGNSYSLYRPLLNCIPEAARLASVLASSQRSEHCLKLLDINDNGEVLTDANVPLLVFLDKKETNIRHRWKRFGSTLPVLINPNSVPGSAVPMNEATMLYCVCSNTLELKGGGIKAEGLTLLPPGKLFLQLCRFTFGLYKKENVDDGSYITKALLLVDPNERKLSEKKLRRRITRAVDFHKKSAEMGEELKCYPEKVVELLNIFDGTDGYPFKSIPWKNLCTNPFISNNHEDI